MQVDICIPTTGRKGGEGEACRWWWVKGAANTLLSNTLRVSDPLSKNPHDGDGGGGDVDFLRLISRFSWSKATKYIFMQFWPFWLFLAVFEEKNTL